ncbi:glycosyltransferase [Clostridium estertheticum]|uniref:glycosyltransferase n=1 Tax=Clostridium estertheticum TaxID=238834 RepID=UPI001C6E561A|nr:glycosyltransferase [Clostridium estertheticum]MBW9151362.1 glycosyltransferase [Clostridium estertheticum]WLC84663.1 glycosyltransferase [Clostridium estertheticum]
MKNLKLSDNCILVFPSVSWEHNWERQHELIFRYAKHTNSEIYIFNTFGYLNYGMKDLAKKIFFRLKNDTHKRTGENPICENMHFVNIKLFIPYHNNMFLRKLNCILVKISIMVKYKELLRFIKEKKTIFWCVYSTDIILDMIDRIEPNLIIFDLAQRRKADKTLPSYVISFEEELVRKSDLVFADSRATCQDYSEIRKLKYFCQGVNVERYLKLERNIDSEILGNIKKPIVGYLGALHSSIDYDLLEYVIKKNQNCFFVFVGNIVDKKAEELLQYENVLFTGRVSFYNIKNYTKYFNIGIIPYLVNDFTNGVSPTKLFEYGIQKIPVVSTNINEVNMFNGFVSIANSKDDFNKSLNVILTTSKEELEKMKNKIFQLSLDNSWEKKFNYFFDEINDSYYNKMGKK